MNRSNICGKSSNNKYFDCPTRMDDGRHFTDYRPNCYVNNMIQFQNNLSSSYDYRQFLINNATSLMEVNKKYTSFKNGNNDCNAVEVPHQSIRVCNGNVCETYQVNENGVGQRSMADPNYTYELPKHSVNKEKVLFQQ